MQNPSFYVDTDEFDRLKAIVREQPVDTAISYFDHVYDGPDVFYRLAAQKYMPDDWIFQLIDTVCKSKKSKDMRWINAFFALLMDDQIGFTDSTNFKENHKESWQIVYKARNPEPTNNKNYDNCDVDEYLAQFEDIDEPSDDEDYYEL